MFLQPYDWFNQKIDILYVKGRKNFRPNCIGFGEFAEKYLWQVSANSPNGDFAEHQKNNYCVTVLCVI